MKTFPEYATAPTAVVRRHADWPFVEGTKKRRWHQRTNDLKAMIAYCEGLGLYGSMDGFAVQLVAHLEEGEPE